VADDITICYTIPSGMEMRWIKKGVFGKMLGNQGMLLIGVALLVFCAFVGSVTADIYVPDDVNVNREGVWDNT
jgi:hypothetical protein